MYYKLTQSEKPEDLFLLNRLQFLLLKYCIAGEIFIQNYITAYKACALIQNFVSLILKLLYMQWCSLQLGYLTLFMHSHNALLV